MYYVSYFAYVLIASLRYNPPLPLEDIPVPEMFYSTGEYSMIADIETARRDAASTVTVVVTKGRAQDEWVRVKLDVISRKVHVSGEFIVSSSVSNSWSTKIN